MRKPRFTPGPWVYPYNNGDEWVRAENGIGIVRVGLHGGPNAHLIAAAPDLYAALERAKHEVKHEQHSGESTADWCDRCAIDAALAKARGET